MEYQSRESTGFYASDIEIQLQASSKLIAAFENGLNW